MIPILNPTQIQPLWVRQLKLYHLTSTGQQICRILRSTLPSKHEFSPIRLRSTCGYQQKKHRWIQCQSHLLSHSVLGVLAGCGFYNLRLSTSWINWGYATCRHLCNYFLRPDNPWRMFCRQITCPGPTPIDMMSRRQ